MQEILFSNSPISSKLSENIESFFGETHNASFSQIIVTEPDVLSSLQEKFKKLAEENKNLITEGLDLANQLELLQAEKSRLDALVTNLKHKLQWQKKPSKVPAISINDEVKGIIVRMLSGEYFSPTPVQCLKIIEAVSAEHIEILASAWKSAEEISCCKKGDRLLKLLAKLVGPYYELLLKGGGDSQARMVFSSKEYAASESATISSDPVHRARRTFTYKGQEIYMERHLRIGVENDLSLTVRVYFAWIPEERKIVIGYCGKHLPVTRFSH